ncbi:DUF116 domain-containing protein [Halanaerobacter jeridensis]|uniref:DUF116 domain-containing protein n=1 Tax=Halanaerobacter jeridensis TaxID=706427 RepID=A0A938XPA9_9FIRM|nr:DUF116 domain-containing protein [Halanaerobacter jeridensis]MBM7556362.1 hypothetical protein [Halanaerobacter jeridensis]
MEEITYDLTQDKYYEDIKDFAQKLVVKGEENHSKIINDFMNFIAAEEIEELRDRKEYIFEFLSLGVLANLYLNDVLQTSKTSYLFMRKLIEFKAKYSKLSKIIDVLQGFLNTTLLHSAQRDNYNYEFVNKDDLNELIIWLESMGEYQEEVQRFKNWQKYFNSKYSVKVSYDLKVALKFAQWFQKQGQARLSQYTKNVKTFLKGKQNKHLWRQDILLRTKAEPEYHLNMLGIEIINQVQRKDFLETEERVILAPTCMRDKSAAECAAQETDLGLQCTHCDRDCNINLIDSLGSQGDFEVVIIDHAYSFADYFAQWREQQQTGLIVIACVPNLLLIGYQLQRLNIPAQVMPLNYCGCQLHWCEKGVTTDMNLDQLLVTLREDPQEKFIQMSIFND